MPNPRIVIQVNGHDTDPNELLIFALPEADGQPKLVGVRVAPPPVPELLPIIMQQMVAANLRLIPNDTIPTLRAFAIAVLNNLGASSDAKPDSAPLQ